MCGVEKGTAMQLFKSCLMDSSIPFNHLETINLEEPRKVENHRRRYSA